MTVVDVPGRGSVGIRGDDPGGFAVERWLTAVAPAGGREGAAPVNALVEVQRRFGGLAPRALLGAGFAPRPAVALTEIRVAVGAEWTEEADSTIPGYILSWPFVSGLPPEYADAVLTAMTDGRLLPLPPGVVTVDRAGHDVVNSSTVAFRDAALALRAVLTARLRGRPVEEEIRASSAYW